MFKLVSLKVVGFKRLNLADKITFPDGRLLIHGRNESGKSTIMETIHYALYGNPLKPSKRASNEDIINYGSPEATIELDFTIDDKHYQVRRVLKKRGGNTHRLSERQRNGTLNTLTTGARAVNDHILEILHGIDSDALLNSCLVEQKELGRLEDSNKQERIKAMSSLLNLEAFVDAKDRLKRDRSELDKTHFGTINRLNEAENASKDYDEAENKKKEAETRIEKIKAELKEAEASIIELEKSLTVIEEMNELQTIIDGYQAEKNVRETEWKAITEKMAQIKEAEQNIKEIEEKLPQAEEALKEAEEKLKVLDELMKLDKERTQAKAQADKASLIVEEAGRRLAESEDSQTIIDRLKTEIKEYSQARNAQKIIPLANTAAQNLGEKLRTLTRLLNELESGRERLAQLKDSESMVDSLKDKREDLLVRRETMVNRRKYGVITAVAGIVLAVLFVVKMYLIIPGLGLMAAGAYIYNASKITPIDEEIESVRLERERVLGDIMRIDEFRETIAQKEHAITMSESEVAEAEETLSKLMGHLPTQPREYQTLIKLSEPESVEKLRDAVQEDFTELTRLETERNAQRETASKLGERKDELKKQEKKLKDHLKTLRELRKAITEKQRETGVNVEEEKQVRDGYTDASNELTQLNADLVNHKKTVSQKEEQEKSLHDVDQALKELEEAITKHGDSLNILMDEHKVTPEDEARIRGDRDRERDRSSTLKKDLSERSDDVSEADTVMKRTRALKKEYPALVEENKQEEFSLEAMRRAITLLDSTRDSIMAGVKQNVEKHMMQFLPILTDNRYSMARIDEEKYVIQIYDREAQHWRGKGVFSGATQDQFSLALRLAFAISTIPSTRGARPGFIFLDEPLSGFDTQRRNGFMEMLQQQLSQHFDQIIVISHLEALREDFPHHLQLEAGRVIESEVQR
ncbi:MAG: SMC family ATPase [Candidatus Bathyarchaeota archaeon]|nr:SMC family ATPase [Candidatus Bathyarchaeota archaeon]